MSRTRLLSSRRTSGASGPARSDAGRPSREHARWTAWFATVLVAATAAWVHGPVMQSQALGLDDDFFITHNALVASPGWTSAARFFSEVLEPSTVPGYYIPLTMTSLMADYAWGGRADDLRVFHRTNLLLHAISVALVLWLLYRLFGALVPAALAALLFGVHPLTVEPVAWVGERKTLLAAVFGFASLLAYVHHVRGGRAGWRAASVACFTLALLSKPTVIMLPVLLVLLDAWPLRRVSRETLLEKWPYLLLSAGFGVITLISHHRTAEIVSSGAAAYLTWPLQACHRLAFYLGKIAWPANLTPVYPPPDPVALSNPAVLQSVVAVATIALACVWALRRTRGPLVAMAFFVVAMAPTLGAVDYSWIFASDKYVYVPAFGLLMLIAAGLAHLLRRPRAHGVLAVIALVSGVMLFAAASATRATIPNWRDSLTLFRHMAAHAPDAPVVRNQLGVLLGRSGDHEAAVSELRRALELRPDYGQAHYNLGMALAGTGRLPEAIAHFREAAERLPAETDPLFNLAMALRLSGDDAAAEEALRGALARDRDHLPSHDQLARLLLARGELNEAVQELREAVRLSPRDAALHFRLGAALASSPGAGREAIAELRAAVASRPDWPEALEALAWTLATSPDPALRDPAEALELATHAERIVGSPGAGLLDTKAAALAAAGEFEAAADTARRALNIAAGLPGFERQAILARVKLYERRVPFIEHRVATPR